MRWEPSVEPVSWFKDRALEEGALSLSPPYQRRPVWRLKERCHLIESILMNCPIPEIYVHRTTTAKGKTTYAVVDGQQRIRSVLKFLGVDKTDAEDNAFALTKLETGSEWYGLAFEDLSEEQKEGFWSYAFSVRYLITKDEHEVRDMFTRLNRYSVALSGQEIRNALFIGPFVELSNNLADDNYLAQQGIVTPSTIRRMGDVELVSELLIGCMYGPQDGSREKIDGFYEEFEEYEHQIPGQAPLKTRYQKVLALIREIIPDLAPARWSNKHDFYSLFVAVGHNLREGCEFRGDARKLRARLERLADYVGMFIENPKRSGMPAYAVQYASAVQKGPSSKARRGARHQVLLSLLKPFFKKA